MPDHRAERRRARTLAASTWPDLEADVATLVVPIGSTEQHGPHLPLDTDTRIAEALAHALATARPDTVVAPALAYGSSGEHAGFPGTLSMGAAALEVVLVELVRSADAFDGVVLVNGHGGNLVPLRRAAAQSAADGRRVLTWSPRVPGGDPHAGRTETSLLLHLAPEVVRLDDARRGDTRPLAETIDALREGGLRSVSANGVLGDPAGASAAEGAVVFTRLVEDLVRAVDDWRR